MIYNFLIPHIRDIQKRGNVVLCACSRTGDYFDILINTYGLEVEEICFKRSPYHPQNILAYKRLSDLIKEKGINTIFCHEPVGGAMGRMVGHRYKCKVIYMAHGFHFYKGAPKSSRIYYYIEKYLSRYTDALITINQEDYEASKEFHAKKIFKVNGIGIDTSKFIYKPNKEYIRKELKLKEEDVLILSVGELIERKNHKTMILGMKYLPKNFHYIIVGVGELNEKLQNIVIKEKITERVHFLGYRRDINNICNSVDIFVMPSYQEGLSVALMEAMACCLPIVASKIRGNVDLVDEEKGGLLINTEDSKGYANAIKKIVTSELQELFGKYNREKLREFELDSVRVQMQKVLEEI